MAGRKSVPKKIKELIRDYGVRFWAVGMCESLILHIEDGLNHKPRKVKVPKKHVCVENGGCKNPDCDK